MSHIKVMDLTQHKGRVWYTTDLHGHYDLLHEQLHNVGFNSKDDILILGGDSTDRGPDSQYVLDYLNEPWIYSVQGNHEAMVVAAYESPDDVQIYNMLFCSGGEWWYGLSEQMQKAIYDTFKSLPLAIELHLPNEVVGIIHAQVPYNNWEEFRKMTAPELEWNGVAIAQWARTNYNKKLAIDVKGVNRVLVGHTPTNSGEVEVFGNVWYADLGSFFRNKISFIQLM